MANARLHARPVVVALVPSLSEASFSKHLFVEKNGRTHELSFSSYRSLDAAIKAFQRNGYNCWVNCNDYWVQLS